MTSLTPDSLNRSQRVLWLILRFYLSMIGLPGAFLPPMFQIYQFFAQIRMYTSRLQRFAKTTLFFHILLQNTFSYESLSGF